MTMYQVPKMATHPLDKYRHASIDYITGSDMSLTGNLYVKGSISGSIDMAGDSIVASYITGGTKISGSLIQASSISGSGIISGATFQGSLVTSIIGSGSAVTGQITITTGAGLNLTQTGNVITIYLA